jgi:hypothetical protein
MTSEEQNHKDIISMKTYVDIRFNDLIKATDLAAENLKVRLDGLNEWRLQNKDERGTYVSRKELDAKLEAIEKGKRDTIAIILSLIGIGIAIFSLLR